MTWEIELENIARTVEEMEAIALDELAVFGSYDVIDEPEDDFGYPEAFAAIFAPHAHGGWVS